MLCGRADRPLEDHHSINLGHRLGELNNHPLNCCRLCSFEADSCHEIVGDVHNKENEQRCLKATYLYLGRTGYHFDKKAKEFMKLNPKAYV